jgi:methionine-gamma-lyase
MVNPFLSKTHIGNHTLHPETLMLNYGYDPQCRKELSIHRCS